MKYRAFIGGKLLSHSIELPYTEGAESACLIRPWDSLTGSLTFPHSEYRYCKTWPNYSYLQLVLATITLQLHARGVSRLKS